MAATGEWVAMMMSGVDGDGICFGDAVPGTHWCSLMVCGSVGRLAMCAASCGAIVSMLVMLYLAVASWMVLWERR